MTSVTVEPINLLGFITGGIKPPSKDPNQSWGFWQHYQCVKKDDISRHFGPYVCSKTRVPFFEMSEHRFHTKAPSILPDSLQRQRIWWSNSDVTFWPPTV